MGEKLTEVHDFLSAIPDGKVSPDHRSQLECLLSAAWDELSGGDDESMQGYKLIGRVENMEWKSPVLTCRIERHGGTVQGSSMASVHTWEVNIDSGEAAIIDRTHRQLKPMSPKLSDKELESIIEELCHAITSMSEHPSLGWIEKGRKVRVLIGKACPTGNAKQTDASRRKRFRSMLNPKLEKLGWRSASNGTSCIYKNFS